MSEAIPNTASESRRCIACTEPLVGAYCAKCGQPAEVPRFTWKYLLSELLVRLTFEKGLMLTTREMAFRPGSFVRDYISGIRRGHSSPFAFFFIITALAVIVSHYFFGSTEELLGNVREEGPFSFFTASQMDAYLKLSDQLSYNTSLSMLGLTIPFAFMVWLSFLRTGYNLVECTIFSLYTLAFACLIWIFLLPLSLLIPKLLAAVITMLLVYPVVIIYVGRSFFGRGWWNYFKLLFAFFFSYFSFSIVVGIGMLVIILAFY